MSKNQSGSSETHLTNFISLKSDFSVLFGEVREAMALLSTEGFYEAGNPAAETLWAQLLFPDFSREGPFVTRTILEAFQQSCAGEIVKLDPLEYITPERPLTLQISFRPLLLQHSECKVLLIIDDLTASIAQQRALDEATLEKEKAERARAEHDGFIARLAHEMRNPLNGIFGITELLTDHPEAAAPDLFRKLHACSNALSALIDDTLDLRRLEQTRLRLEEQVFHLGELIEYVVDVHASEAESKGIRLSASDTEQLHFVSGDGLRVRQILANLLTNAIKYTSDGGSIDVRCSLEHKDHYRFEVRDTGVGISKSELETIFEPYFQVAGVAPGSKKGIGLGLSIVKNLVDLMEGAMGVDSVPGHGSTFWVSLTLPGAQPPESKTQPLELLKGNILVADDNTFNRDILKLQLSRFGVTVSLAGHGQEALQVLQEQRFDVVLMDCHMPTMNGYEAARQIRAHPELYGAPVIIALTASATDRARKRCLESGMNEFLRKPVRQKELHGVLASCLLSAPSSLTPSS